MEKKVNFAQYQQVKTSDLQNMQNFAEASHDHVVADTIVSDMRYAGLLAAKSGPAAVNVAAGRLYVSGAVYFVGQSTSFDFTSQLPVAAKKNVLITAWGSEADTNVAAVNFLNVTQSTPQAPVYTPQEVATEHDRVCNLGTAIGSESPAPSDPVIGATLLPIARVVLSPTGVDSVTMLTGNAVPNLEKVDGRVGALEDFEAVAAPQLASLASNIARLSNQNSSNAQTALTGQILSRIATLEAKDGIPSNAASSSADFFLAGSNSDLANPLSLCEVSEGVRFAFDGVSDAVIALLNPIDPTAKIAAGALFPAYSEKLRQAVGPKTGQVQVSAYTYQSNTFVKKTWTRTRTRYGSSFVVSSASAFWTSGSYDPISHIFTLNGETYLVQSIDLVYFLWFPWYQSIRLEQFWTDTITQPYLDVETSTNAVNGTKVSETFSFGQDMWLSSIGLIFTQVDTPGAAPVTLALCEVTSSGLPDLANVLESVTLAASALNVGSETRFTFPRPAYLQSGHRYALTIVTAGNHFLATTDGPNFAGGVYFTDIAGISVPDLTKHVVANFYTCSFANPRTVLDLQPLQLSGGITGIDVLTGAIAPASTTMTFEVQVNGHWISLDQANAGALNAGGNLPALLPFHVVMQGTPDIMPAIDTLKSQVEVTRPRTSFTHIWPLGGRSLPAPSQHIRVTQHYESFDPAFHTTAASILTGAGFATQTAASSYSDVTNADGSVDRTWVFDLGAPVSAYKYKTAGTTTTALKVFVMAWLKDWVL